MKRPILSLMMIAALLAVMAVPSANAALPANMSWVKYSGNPVAPTDLCGPGITPMRPSVLVESANNYKMYFTTNAGIDGAQIYLATTTDGGQTWACGNGGNPVLLVGGSGAWDDTRVVAPTVIKDVSTYKMWYSGRNASAVWAIGYATSADGVSWTKYSSNPVFTVGGTGAWDSQIVREPSVVLVSGTYHMFYSGTDRWPYFAIGHATSTDGTTWARGAANPVLSPTPGSWDANEAYSPSVVMNGSTFEMFYSGNTGGTWMTGHASSPDGTTWMKDGNAIIAPSASGWDSGDSTDYVAAILDGTTWKVFYSGAGSGGYQIGLATLTNQAQLTFNPMAAIVAVGGTTDVYIDLTAVTDLYGYQFQVNYDATKVSATAVFDNSFFDTGTNASIPSSWNATCAAGVCKFAVSKVAPGSAVSGSGHLAKITFTGVAAGRVPLTFTSDILANINGGSITHSTTTGWLEVYGSATISGTVALQGRLTPIDSGTVTLTDEYGYFAPTTVSFSASDGTWTATVPVLAGGSTYDADAAHSLYLSNRKTGIAVSPGGSYPQGLTTLKGGDADNSGVIDISDLTCIGGAFGGPPTTCGTSGSSDINADLTVNILDLVLAGGNYGLASPQPW